MSSHRLSRAALAAIATVLIAGGCATARQWEPYPTPAALESLSAEQWRSDIEFLRSELPRRNPHFEADPGMAADFDGFARSLATTIDADTTADEVVAGIAQLLALVGEGHTALNAYPTSYFPVIAGWFADGFYIAGADAEHSAMIGAKVKGIRDAAGTDLSVSEVEQRLNSVISVDHENGYRPAQSSVRSDPVLMRGLGLAAGSGLTYLVELDGAPAQQTVTEVPGNAIDIVRANANAPRPLAAYSSEPNWYVRIGTDGEPDEAGSTIYLSYDVCELEASKLLRALIGELKSTTVDRLIVDLRNNSGGNSIPGTIFARRLSRISGLNRPGGIYVLIGPYTFSSGMMLAVDLMDKTEATFAGLPLAESPNSWGEVKRFALPNSGLIVGHSTKYFEYGAGKDLRLDADGNLVPDPGFRIDRSFAEYANGIDPVVEAVLAQP